MINAIGLQNIGVEAFCREALPVLRQRGAVVAVNVFGERMEEYVEVIERCEREDGIAAYELNVSCPNVTAGGMEFGHDPAQLERLTGMCRAATRRQLWVKLSPNAPDLVGTARAAVAGGADALTLINTLRAIAIDAERRRPVLANACGGLSGPAIKPIALRMVWEVHKALPEVPVVGIGGVESGRDVAEFLLAGASAVQVGHRNLPGPRRPAAHPIRARTFLRGAGCRRGRASWWGHSSGTDACGGHPPVGGGARHLRARRDPAPGARAPGSGGRRQGRPGGVQRSRAGAGGRGAGELGMPVFLDLKLHDIPNTVERAARNAARLGVAMLTVHASGGEAMLRAAVAGAASAERPPAVLAVTVLTSLDDGALAALGIPGGAADRVAAWAALAQRCGCAGVVCSPHEAAMLRSALGPEFLLVTPGVRPAGESSGDQRRVATPREAVAAGARPARGWAPDHRSGRPGGGRRDDPGGDGLARSLGYPRRMAERFPCDTHIHTARCGHATGSDGELVEAAIARGLAAIALTDHAPFYWLSAERRDPRLAMASEDLPRYVEDVLALKERYRGRIEVLLGVEADYIAGQEEVLVRLLEAYPFDVVLGSVHFLDGWLVDAPTSLARLDQGQDEVDMSGRATPSC